jgi:hypothetical protein
MAGTTVCNIVLLALCLTFCIVDVTNALPTRTADDDELMTLKRLLELDWLLTRRDNEVHAPNNERRTTARRNDPNKFLERFGYLKELPPGVSHDPANRQQAIKKFQKMYHIKATGQLDEATLTAMAAPRCGLPDNETDNVKRFMTPGYKWPKKSLTYRFRNFLSSSVMDQQTQRQALERALKTWSDVSKLTFREVTEGADINFSFDAAEHSDGPQNAFDGPGGVLAHAFYPESGETHFDLQEDWRNSETDGVDLMTVAAHELGHALGLGHSTVPGALMAPYYQGYDPSFILPEDDKRAIQSLYEAKGPQPAEPSTTRTTTTTTTARPTTATRVTQPTQPSGSQPPDRCTVNFRAATQIYDNSIHVFSGSYLWRLTEAGLDTDYPRTIQSVYSYAPDAVDAATFSLTTSYTYLFRGSKVWRYYGFRLLGGRTFDPNGYASSPMAGITDKLGNIYLIKGPMCWQFNETTMTVNAVPKTCFQLFPNAPLNMDASIRLVSEPNIVYFFRGPFYYKYDESIQRIVDGYPKLKAAPWMGESCGGQPYSPK